jgi:hypothetical protein
MGALLGILPFFAQAAFAQAPGPPPIVRVFHEYIKEGKAVAHEKTESAFMQAAARAKYPAYLLGLASLTGTAQAVFLEGHDSIASIADSQAIMDRPEFGAIDASDAELRISQRSMIAVFRPNLSYGADQINLPRMRFFSIETIRIKHGQEQKFTDLARVMVGGAVKSGDNQPVAVYEIISGAPGGTYLLLEPMESLKSMDEEPQRERALLQAVGWNRAEYDRQANEAIESEEATLFAVDPTMSYVSKEWAGGSPDFWKSASK